MTDQQDDEIRRVLKDVFPPVRPELSGDLWPRMLRKLDTQEPRVAWYDWALVGLVGGVLLAFPELILVFMYHL